jgi:hypothetical protein
MELLERYQRHWVRIGLSLVNHYLRLAAGGRDFYGLLARAVLGRSLVDAGETAFEDSGGRQRKASTRSPGLPGPSRTSGTA